jgi:hypothetical protein
LDWKSVLRRIDNHEDGLLAHFVVHPVLASLGALSREAILALLLQRRFLSLAFSPFYDLAIDGLSDEASRACLREVLREEYTHGAQPTHREDLVSDLLTLGATRDQILSTTASPTTVSTIARLLLSLRKVEDEALYQIKVLTILRLAGEVLVAAEYEQLWPHLERLGLSAPPLGKTGPSVFYYPHMCHDGRKHRFASEWDQFDPVTHSDQLTRHLKNRLIHGPPEGVECFLEAAEVAVEIKRSFYDQFLRT